MESQLEYARDLAREAGWSDATLLALIFDHLAITKGDDDLTDRLEELRDLEVTIDIFDRGLKE